MICNICCQIKKNRQIKVNLQIKKKSSKILSNQKNSSKNVSKIKKTLVITFVKEPQRTSRYTFLSMTPILGEGNLSF